MNYTVRPLRPEEYDVLQDFLLESVFVPEGGGRPPRSFLQEPEMQVYIQDFGMDKHDFALAAEADGEIIGAVWARIMPDYGHLDDETPSLAMAVLPSYRHAGVGTALLEAMLDLLRRSGYQRTSLSVQKANTAALGLYQKTGFRPAKDHGSEYIMVREFSL